MSGGEDHQATIDMDSEHEGFAATRSVHYVFVPAKDHFFTTLDQHADTIEGDVKLPLVIAGNEGSGKSALLANWVLKRRATKHKDEFLFQHFVESSAQSSHLGHMLFRLETELKSFFQLREIEVPESEERLRWSLNRFLSAAVKKKFPARIVIVIDGVNKLKGAGCRDGELYWLPTELPPCVRFIVSTVEHEHQYNGGSDEIIPHRTFAELMRRNCPVIRMEPLSIGIRHSIINSYVSQHPELDLQENQQFRAVTCALSAQPIFLRTLLESIRLGILMTAYSVDSLIDIFLRCGTAYELVEKTLEICIASISNEAYVDMLGKVLAIVYVSRNGVTEEELWGIVKRVSKVDADAMHQQKFFAILKNFTMVVHGLHSFSHEVYRSVVYHKFIGNNDTYIRWHNVMARYFGQLPTCDRKLTCLPYHLEVAGSWNKVKNCLTDIEMFNLWWTPNFKKDFIKYWSSLTAVRHSSNDSSSDDTNGPIASNHSKKPTYDVVEEYVKSVEEYRSQKHPRDEVLADTILRVADFLMEFAVNGHEANADVPMNIHPVVLSSDLASLGVPHVEVDEEGRSVLVMPTMTVKKDDGTKTQGDAPVTANEDLPMCTTYYFARWMWIQYPLIALGNCDQRYLEGIRIRAANNPWERENRRKKNAEGSLCETQDDDAGKHTKHHAVGSTSFDFDHTGIINSMKLPEIKFVKRCARSIRRATKQDLENDEVPDSTQLKIIGLQDTNRNLRDEFDFCYQQKLVLSRRLEEVKTQLRDITCALESTGMYDVDLQKAIEKDKEVTQRLDKALFINKNLRNLLNMCLRHPANSPATIFEVEKKLEQDTFIIAEIKARLWEQRFEQQVHNTTFKKMKQLVKSGVHMHTKLLELRYVKKKDLQTQQAMTVRDTDNQENGPMGLEETKSRRAKRQFSQNVSLEMYQEESAISWQEKWQVITSRTGITDPDIFFQRLNNGGVLEDQINNLKRQSEARLNALKNESMAMEAELEEVRAEASILGGQSREIYEKHKELASVQQTVRRAKEKAESAELLQQQVIAGLNHINELLGVNHTDREANIIDTIRDIEGVLETLVEENEKQQQGLGAGGSSSESPGSFTRNLPNRDGGFNDGRPSELENVLQKYQDPRTRFVAAKATEDVVIASGRDELDDDYEDEGMWDRRFVKTQSQKTLRSLAKKRAATGQPDLAATM